jgi:carbon-monoxide dehydrogenase small subunit
MSTSLSHIAVRVEINGQLYDREVEHRQTLADFLRENLSLTGTHVGCEQGVCGSCTVLVDGISARACLMLAAQADSAKITTVEGLACNGTLHPLQQAFWDKHGLQCGFCTPGILISLVELLQADAQPSEAQIREVLSGHLCRCTGYQNIVAAALEAAAQMRGPAP